MKAKLFLILFIAAMPLFSQDMEKDTIQLKETVVNGKRKPKTVTYKFRKGTCTGHEQLDWNSELAAMAYDMPKGRLKTLQFNFNNPFEKGDDIYYRDSNIELSFYEIGTEGEPGNKIASKIFMVSGNHRGKMAIDIYDLNIHNESGIYISLKRQVVGEERNRNEFEVDCSCSESTKYSVAWRNPKTGLWKIQPAAPFGRGAFHLTVTIEQ